MMIKISTRRGQVVLEYLLLFAAVALVTVLGMTSFDNDIRTNLQGFFHAAANDITK